MDNLMEAYGRANERDLYWWVGDIMEVFGPEVGIDLNSVHHFQVFMPAEMLLGIPPIPLDEDTEIAAVWYFDLNEEEIITRLGGGEQAGSIRYTHRGYNVYHEPWEYGPGLATGFAGPGAMIVGTERGVLAALDVAAGAPAASRRAVEALESLGEWDMSIAVEMPQESPETWRGTPKGRELLQQEAKLPELLDHILWTAPVSTAGVRYSEGAIEMKSISLFADGESAAVFREELEKAAAMPGVETEISQEDGLVTFRVRVDAGSVWNLFGLLPGRE